MKTAPATQVGVSVPRVTLMMILCGVMSAASIGAVSAATTSDDVPSITVKFSQTSLATDAGTRAVYRKLVTAAAAVCPAPDSSSRFLSETVKQCREQAIARAVRSINSPRLAALYANSTKSG